MSRSSFFSLLLLFFIFPGYPAYYSLWEQDIFIEKNDHVLINSTQLSGLVSDHILQTSGDLTITLVLNIFFFYFSNTHIISRNIQMIMPFLMYFCWMILDINVI